MGKVYVGNNKVEIILNLGVAVAGASITFNVLKPEETIPVVWTAEPYAIDGVTQYGRYLATSSDLDRAGIYQIQPYIILADSSFSGKTDTYILRVYDSFK